MAEYSRIAKGSFTSTGAAKTILLPFQPQIVKLYNYTAAFNAPAANAVISAYWDVQMGQGFALETGVYNSTPVLVADAVIANGISTFSAGLQFQFGPQVVVSSVVKATGVFTTGSAHGLNIGDIVMLEGLYVSSTTGMPQICGMPFEILAASFTSTTFTINWNVNQSNYTGGTFLAGAFVKKVLYPFMYEPGVNFISTITTGSTTTVTTTAPHNFVVGQEIAFRIPSSWGTTQLNSLPNNTTPGSPVYYYVTAVTTNNRTFVCNAVSSSFTAFNTNQTVASVPGLSFPQVLAVGDVNSGGVAYSGGALYPSPVFPTFSGGVPTINGPAISGAFVNNTAQGFVIGAGAGVNLTSSVLVGANGNQIYWEAYFPDIALP